MKKLLVVAALATVVAVPAFAQQPSNGQYRVAAYERNGNANPDFQLGGSRWKSSKAKKAKHHGTQK